MKINSEANIWLLRKRSFLQRNSTWLKCPYSALHKDVAIGFVIAIGFRNEALTYDF